MKAMLSTLLSLLESKKAVTMMLTSAAGLVAKLGYDVDVSTILVLATPAMVYIGAQGWADQGKGAAQVAAKSQEVKS